jgi:hypothetical protein
MDNLRKVVNAIPKQPQTQVALNDQLHVLISAANRLGLYDAADYLTNATNRKN